MHEDSPAVWGQAEALFKHGAGGRSPHVGHAGDHGGGLVVAYTIYFTQHRKAVDLGPVESRIVIQCADWIPDFRHGSRGSEDLSRQAASAKEKHRLGNHGSKRYGVRSAASLVIVAPRHAATATTCSARRSIT